MNCGVKIIKDQKAAIIKHHGYLCYIDKIVQKLTNWISKNEIDIVGSPFSIFYGNFLNVVSKPKNLTSENIFYGIGIPIDINTYTNNLKIVETPSQKVIYAAYEGSYLNLIDTYQSMIDYLNKNNYEVVGDLREIYLNGSNISEEKLKIELQLPIK